MEVGERFAKDFAGQILGRRPFSNAARNIGINQFEISLVHVRKRRAIPLRRFHQAPRFRLVNFPETRSLCRFAARHWVPNLYKLRRREKVMAGSERSNWKLEGRA